MSKIQNNNVPSVTNNKFDTFIKKSFNNIKSSLFPKYAFILSIISIVLLTVSILILNWIKLKSPNNKLIILQTTIKRFIDDSKHYLLLAKQDTNKDIKKSHLIQSKTLLCMAKDMA